MMKHKVLTRSLIWELLMGAAVLLACALSRGCVV